MHCAGAKYRPRLDWFVALKQVDCPRRPRQSGCKMAVRSSHLIVASFTIPCELVKRVTRSGSFSKAWQLSMS
jgi:hypothetical protein